MKHKLMTAVVALATLGATATAVAQSEANARGEVRRMDAAKGTITIKHGAIDDLNLPAMTLQYEADPALLQGIAPGDHVRFRVRHENNRYEVIELRK